MLGIRLRSALDGLAPFRASTLANRSGGSLGTLYSASGRVSGKVVLAFLLSGLPAGVIGGCMAMFVAYMPLSGLSTVAALIVAALVLSVLLGVTLNAILRLAHVRNRRVGHVLALFSGMVATYSGTAAFFWIALRTGGTEIPVPQALRPDFLLEMLSTVDALSAAVQTLLIVIVVLAFAWIPAVISQRTTSAPYCEACGLWCDEFAPAVYLKPTSAAQLQKTIEAWDLEAVLALERATDQDRAMDIIETARCSGCRDFATVRLKRVHHEYGGKTTVELRMPPHVAPGVDVEMLAALLEEAD